MSSFFDENQQKQVERATEETSLGQQAPDFPQNFGITSNIERLLIEMREERNNKFEKLEKKMERIEESFSSSVKEIRADFEKTKKDQALLPLIWEWITQNVTIKNGQVCTEKGKLFTLKEFKQAIINTPWSIFPEEYEVECCNCKKQIDVSSNLRSYKVSVKCPHCETKRNCVYVTLLGTPKAGFEWIDCLPCEHAQQVQIGTRPKNCGFCGNEANGHQAPLHYYRTPTRKQ